MDQAVFLDTSFAIALASKSDKHHNKALGVLVEIQKSKCAVITTWAVIIELANALAKPQFRVFSVSMIELLLNDPAIEIVSVTDELSAKAFSLYKDRMDKKWGLTDCISFVVMKERGIRAALTADEDFEQAGFSALMKG